MSANPARIKKPKKALSNKLEVRRKKKRKIKRKKIKLVKIHDAECSRKSAGKLTFFNFMAVLWCKREPADVQVSIL